MKSSEPTSSSKENKILLRAYLYRIYPNAQQRHAFACTFGCVRKIWNLMLADKIRHYQETGKSLAVTPAKYKKEYPYLKEVDSLALANVQLNLQQAYKNFFDRVKKGKKAGFPRFKSRKKSHHSYSTNNQKGSVRIENGKIRLPKVGWVKIIQHRPIPKGSTIKTVTVRQTKSGKYYVSVLTEYENQVLPIIPQTFVGLDFSMHELYVDSEGNHAAYPRFYRQAEKKLIRLQRSFSRTVVGSANHEKMRRKLARLHERIASQRRDFLEKASRHLVDRFDCIAIETLSVKDMAKSRKTFHFGKSIMDNGWKRFERMLEYKLAWQGKSLVRVDKWFPSSQLCHVCGYKNTETKDLSVRSWTCPKCQTTHDRDENAAINIREEGKRLALA